MVIKSGKMRIDSDIRKNFNDIMDNTRVASYGNTDGEGIGYYLGEDGKLNVEHPSKAYEILRYSSFVGISQDFSNQMNQAIEAYVQKINTKLDSFAVDIDKGFRGDELVPAIQKFIDRINNICKNYTDVLKQTEQKIIESVEKQYGASDVNISEQIPSGDSDIFYNKK